MSYTCFRFLALLVQKISLNLFYCNQFKCLIYKHYEFTFRLLFYVKKKPIHIASWLWALAKSLRCSHVCLFTYIMFHLHYVCLFTYIGSVPLKYMQPPSPQKWPVFFPFKIDKKSCIKKKDWNKKLFSTSPKKNWTFLNLEKFRNNN